MKATSTRLVAMFIASVASGAQSFLPGPLPASRYQKMLDSSPFALARAPEARVDTAPSPFADLYVAAIAQLKDADGKLQDLVTIKSRADQTTFTLFGSEPSKERFQLVNIEWSDKVGASKVTLKRGSESGVVEFDQANLQAPMQSRPAPRVPQAAGFPSASPLQRSGLRPPVMPRPTTIVPVPSQPVPPSGAVQQVATPQLPSLGTRPRARIIDSKP